MNAPSFCSERSAKRRNRRVYNASWPVRQGGLRPFFGEGCPCRIGAALTPPAPNSTGTPVREGKRGAIFPPSAFFDHDQKTRSIVLMEATRFVLKRSADRERLRRVCIAKVRPMPDSRPMLGPYEILEIIGKGGMATVYRGRRRETGQIVAIKVMEAQFASNAVLVKRFEQEYAAASRLRHPNIVQVWDSDRTRPALPGHGVHRRREPGPADQRQGRCPRPRPFASFSRSPTAFTRRTGSR